MVMSTHSAETVNSYTVIPLHLYMYSPLTPNSIMFDQNIVHGGGGGGSAWLKHVEWIITVLCPYHAVVSGGVTRILRMRKQGQKIIAAYKI